MDNYGETALMNTCLYDHETVSHISVVRLLLQAGQYALEHVCVCLCSNFCTISTTFVPVVVVGSFSILF